MTSILQLLAIENLVPFLVWWDTITSESPVKNQSEEEPLVLIAFTIVFCVGTILGLTYLTIEERRSKKEKEEKKKEE